MNNDQIAAIDKLHREASDIPIALPGALARYKEAKENFLSVMLAEWPNIRSALTAGK